MQDDIYSLIYNVFTFFSDLPVTLNSPVNFWFWLMLMVTPALIFFVSPDRTRTSHVLRVLVAVGLGYVLVNLSYYAGRAYEWRHYNECLENISHPDRNPEMPDECGHIINIGDSGTIIFLFILGWIPAAFYAGLWEGLWRIRHRKKILEMGDSYRGRWFSNLTIILSLFSPFMVYFLPWLIFSLWQLLRV